MLALAAVGVAESVAVAVTLKVPATVGVPDTAPFAATLTPSGKPVAVQL